MVFSVVAVMTSQRSECNRKGEGGTRDFLDQRSHFCPERSEEDSSLSYCVGVVVVSLCSPGTGLVAGFRPGYRISSGSSPGD